PRRSEPQAHRSRSARSETLRLGARRRTFDHGRFFRELSGACLQCARFRSETSAGATLGCGLVPHGLYRLRRPGGLSHASCPSVLDSCRCRSRSNVSSSPPRANPVESSVRWDIEGNGDGPVPEPTPQHALCRCLLIIVFTTVLANS